MSDEGLEAYVYNHALHSNEDADVPKEDRAQGYGQYSAFATTEHPSYPPHFWETNQSPIIDLSRRMNAAQPLSQIQADEALSLADPPRDFPPLDISSADSASLVPQDNDELSTETCKPTLQPISTPHDGDTDQDDVYEQGLCGGSNRSPYSREAEDEPWVTVSSSFSHSGMARSSEPRTCPSASSGVAFKTDGQSECALEADDKADAPHEPDGHDHAKSTPAAVDPKNQAALKQFLDSLESGVLESLGYKKETPQEFEDSKAKSSSVSGPGHGYACSEPQCTKKFARKCELKKHEKRHEKPYGCTFQGCTKKFGSKNDWKRHENSQHFMLEMWKCDEKHDRLVEPCGKVSHRRELFRGHLSKEHHINDPNVLDVKLETCRVGRNCEARFWCGFCQKIIAITQKGLQAWAERFNHIDDHFSGRNNQAQREISEWKNVDPANPRVESVDSDDSSDVSSPPPPPATITNVRYSAKDERPRLHSSKSKRKREDGSAHSTSKRAKAARRYYCVRKFPTAVGYDLTTYPVSMS
ncbi:Uu.00g102640.m01.CDS01 [Anthostomella pinea]|uniref:Uu.00g102640.m01.CDS01 n=1 Tax=Anthostomella pinea TaxID=933095 RepID=A0AAI8VD96_9PEZI|nr:Uu.00g102640.m01.CDS01 [Anthostomella pinea]